MAALPDWFILSRDIKNRKLVFSKQRIKKMEIMKICVRNVYINHKVIENIFIVQCDDFEEKKD